MAASVRFIPQCMFKTIRSCGSRYSSSFRSVYSLDKLYPDSESRQCAEHNQEQPGIPVDRLNISYSKSGGPGGQNVNKVNTKAEVRFHLASADWIPEDVKQKISVQQKNRLNKNGEFIIVSEVSRYQMRNLADCLQKIQDILSEASKKPNVVPKETIELRRMRVEIMNKERLKQKKIASSIKQSRRMDVD